MKLNKSFLSIVMCLSILCNSVLPHIDNVYAFTQDDNNMIEEEIEKNVNDIDVESYIVSDAILNDKKNNADVIENIDKDDAMK